MINDTGSVEILNNEIWLAKFPDVDPLNIYNLVVAMDIFESLDSYTLQADVYISEGIELLNYLPAGGEEILEFAMASPDRRTHNYRFMVERIEAVSSNPMGNQKTYRFRCTTEDFVKNASKVYTRKYKEMEYDRDWETDN